MNWIKAERKWDVLEKPNKNEVVVWPIDEKGKEEFGVSTLVRKRPDCGT